jgi:osmoprotectant transport system ATP-binding protein
LTNPGKVLELRGVSKEYEGLVALEPTNLSVGEGRTTVLIGPSGCGKSTLLRIIMGLVKPDTGAVHFDGRKIGPANILDVRRGMGYVIQEGGLFPHLTARGNVTLMASYLGWPKSRSEERLGKLVELTRFPLEALDRFPAELSGGQRQRVSLMRALMLDPTLLLLDEPLGALDPMIRSEMQAELREIFRALGKTVLLVTHDLGEAAYFGDEIILLRDGRIVQSGSLRELVESPAERFVGRFIKAQRSLLEGLTGEDPR